MENGMADPPDARAASRPSAIPWPPILLVAAIAGPWVLGRAAPLPWPAPHDPFARVIGWCLCLAGLVLFAWGVAALLRRGTTVLPDKGATRLVTDGPFRYSRNPLYLSEVLALSGVAALAENLWFAVAALAFAPLVTWLAILPEERHLEARFGQGYLAYKARTRRWI